MVTLALSAPPALSQSVLPAGLVYLRAVDASIAQDIRYAGSNNFTGRPLPGYDAPECILRADAAAALKRVQTDLSATGLSLKVYDCYRPERAVRTMVRWASDWRADSTGKRFHPRLEKRTLLAGYIAARSRHSTGTAVDVTLVQPGHGRLLASSTATSPDVPCTAPAPQRGDVSIDMGTGFDCFDLNSHTNANEIGAAARGWRSVLVAAMAKRGFRSYHREWWHFSYASPNPLVYYDFPVRPAPAALRGRME